MAGLRARIGEGLSEFRNELPVITGRVQRQLEDPKGGGVSQLAVRSHGRDGGVIGAAGPNNEFAYAIRLVQCASGCLGCKTFIDMVMAVQNQVGLGGIQQLPEWLGIGIGAPTGTIQGDMPVGQGALVRMGFKVGLQPFILS